MVLLCVVTLPAPLPAGLAGSTGTLVVIDKADKSLVLRKNGHEAARFTATFGLDPDSDKTRKHDLATPEGLFVITYKKHSRRFNQLMGLSYPNLANAEKGLAGRVITTDEYRQILKAFQKPLPTPCCTSLGCGIAIHGGGIFRYSDHTRERDWTEGCVALDNPDMEKLFHMCRPGDPVIIFNSRRNLFGIIRPFTAITDKDADGMPLCPDGVCTYAVDFFTDMGLVRISIREGRTYGRSLLIKVYSGGDIETPHLVITDRNADGHISPLDSVEYQAYTSATPQEIYAEVRDAVIAALRSGKIGGRDPAHSPSASQAGPER